MIEFAHKDSCEDLILFVHGFTGGKDTWKHAVDGYFHEHLLEDQFVRENFDIAYFEYHTTLLNLFPAANSIRQRLTSLFKTIQPKSVKNISVEEISKLLRSRIRFELSDYKNIVVIAHSMGGLVTKSCILQDLSEGKNCQIKLLISLAVPHLGVNLASYGKLLLNNKQVEDLAPLSELCPKLNDAWVKQSLKPDVKYFIGAYDEIVKKNSAIGTDTEQQDAISCDDDHISISKPEKKGLVVSATLRFLKDFKNSITPFEVQKILNSDQYKDEIFVLKLLLADVHDASVRHSKEYFLNAEYIRKLLSSSSDQQKLKDLYDRIRVIYQNSYEKHVGVPSGNSTTLVAAVHDAIIQEDSKFLKVASPMLQALHKMGMLHQLANDLGNDVWWSEERSHDALSNLRSKSVEPLL